MQLYRPHSLIAVVAVAPFLALPPVVEAATVANPICPTETALYNPDSGSDIPGGSKAGNEESSRS